MADGSVKTPPPAPAPADLLTEYTKYLQTAPREPLAVAVATYAVVFISAAITRLVADRVFKKNSFLHIFVLEAITSLQMCTCVYENGIIIANYGLWGFFFAVSALLTVAGFSNRGHFGNILSYIERAWFKEEKGKNEVTWGHVATVLLGQLIGGTFAFWASSRIWYYSSGYSAIHDSAFSRLNDCVLRFTVPLDYLPFAEAACCFALRFIVGQFCTTPTTKKYMLPAIIAGSLTFSIAFVGAAGMNPVIAYARLTACRGLPRQYFFITYWIAPIIGWVAGAYSQKWFDKKLWKRSKKAESKPAEKREKLERTTKKETKKDQ